MNSTAKTNVTTLPSSPKAQTAKDVMGSFGERENKVRQRR
jgi:hypothetical protein